MEKKYRLKKDMTIYPYANKGTEVELLETGVFVIGINIIGELNNPKFNFDEWIEEVRERERVNGWVLCNERNAIVNLGNKSKEECVKSMKLVGYNDKEWFPIHIKEVEE